MFIFSVKVETLRKFAIKAKRPFGDIITGSYFSDCQLQISSDIPKCEATNPLKCLRQKQGAIYFVFSVLKFCE